MKKKKRSVFDVSSIYEKWSCFRDACKSSADRCLPLMRATRKRPWISSAILSLINMRDNARRFHDIAHLWKCAFKQARSTFTQIGNRAESAAYTIAKHMRLNDYTACELRSATLVIVYKWHFPIPIKTS